MRELAMTVIRCPQCDIVITSDEARTGSCPECHAPLAATSITEEPRAYPTQERTSGSNFGAAPYRNIGGGHDRPLASRASRLGARMIDGIIALIAIALGFSC